MAPIAEIATVANGAIAGWTAAMTRMVTMQPVAPPTAAYVIRTMRNLDSA
jgi:hypothetical protein